MRPLCPAAYDASVRGPRSIAPRVVAWVLCAASVGFEILAIFYQQPVGNLELPAAYGMGRGAAIPLSRVVLVIAFATVGALIVGQRPSNLIGWLIALIGLDSGIEDYAIWYGGGVVVGVASRPFAELALWVSSWNWVVADLATVALLPLIFPEGRLPSRRWRPVLFVAIAAILCEALVLAFRPGPLFMWPAFQNPYSASGTFADVLAFAAPLGLFLSVVGAVLAAASVFVRYRRAERRERLQLKWFAYAAMLVATTLVVTVVLRLLIDPVFGDARVEVVAFFLALAAVPISVGIAILRHQLYDIDTIVSRTFVYGGLTALLAGLYAASIRLFQTVFVALTGNNSDFAIVLSTLVLASAFTPARRGMETVADRWLGGAAERALDKFADQLELVAGFSVVDRELLARRIVRECTTGLDAVAVRVTLARTSGGSIVASAGADGAAAVEVPIEHAGQRVGAIILGPRKGERAYRRHELEALHRTADVIGRLFAEPAL